MSKKKNGSSLVTPVEMPAESLTAMLQVLPVVKEEKKEPHLLFLIEMKELREILEKLKKAYINDPTVKHWQQKIDDELRDFETTEKYRRAAEGNHEHEGSLEFDEGCVVSMGDDSGAYVQGWRWVTDEEAGIETEEEDEETVLCIHCKTFHAKKTSHLDRDGEHVCDSCWDERMR